MQGRIFSRRYSSSRSPYARRWMTRILLFRPSTKPSETLLSGRRPRCHPMTINHLGELLVGLEPPPLERGAPILEEAPCPTLILVPPELTERLLEHR